MWLRLSGAVTLEAVESTPVPPQQITCDPDATTFVVRDESGTHVLTLGAGDLAGSDEFGVLLVGRVELTLQTGSLVLVGSADVTEFAHPPPAAEAEITLAGSVADPTSTRVVDVAFDAGLDEPCLERRTEPGST